MPLYLRHLLVGLLLVAPALGQGMLCPCLSDGGVAFVQQVRAADLAPPAPSDHDCCPATTDTSTPPAPHRHSDQPHDCNHCQLQSPEAVQTDPLPAPLVTAGGLDHLHAFDFTAPLPVGLTQPSLLLAMVECDLGPPAPPARDSLLSRGCLLTI